MSRLPRHSSVLIGPALPPAPAPSQAPGNRPQQRVTLSVAAASGARRPIAAGAHRPPANAASRADAPTGNGIAGNGIEWARAASGIAKVNEVGRARIGRVQGRVGPSAFPPDGTKPNGLSGEIFSFLAPTLRDFGVLRGDRQQLALERLERRLAGLDGTVAREAARVIREALRSLAQLREIQNSLIRG
jgi:hypothetical protein